MRQRISLVAIGFSLITALAACGSSDADDDVDTGELEMPTVGRDEAIAVVRWRGKRTTLRCTNPSADGNGYYARGSIEANVSNQGLVVSCGGWGPDGHNSITFGYYRPSVTLGTIPIGNGSTDERPDQFSMMIRYGNEGFTASEHPAVTPFEGTFTLDELGPPDEGRVRGSLSAVFSKVQVMNASHSDSEKPATVVFAFNLPNQRD